jgi:hypothetical protein
MKTKDLTKDQLKAYFDEHVCYEIQHLINTAAGILLKLKVPNGLQFVVVEAFAIHLRNLIFFLYPHKPQEDDVCARDFFVSEETWETVKPKISELLQTARYRANKEVGHLTTARKNGTPEAKEWNVQEFLGEVMPVLELFANSADKVRLSLHKDLRDASSRVMALPSRTK